MAEQMSFGTMVTLWQKMCWEAAVQAQLEAMKGYFGAVEAALKLQEEWRKGMEETIQRLLTHQPEGQKAFEVSTKQLEGVQCFLRFWEEGVKRWEEGLRQAAAFVQTSQRSVEELGKTAWDTSRKACGVS